MGKWKIYGGDYYQKQTFIQYLIISVSLFHPYFNVIFMTLLGIQFMDLYALVFLCCLGCY